MSDDESELAVEEVEEAQTSAKKPFTAKKAVMIAEPADQSIDEDVSKDGAEDAEEDEELEEEE